MSISKLRLSLLVAGAALVGAAFVGGVAVAQSSGEIHACVKSGGALLISDSCKRNQTPLVWNVQGPPGPAGAKGDTGGAGPQGAPGAAGVSGYEIVEQPVSLDANRQAAITLVCPAGKRVITGGWTSGAEENPDTTMSRSGPDAGGFGWTSAIRNHEAGTVHVIMRIVCATVGTASP